MARNESYPAFFDLDNTIVDGNTGAMLVLRAYREKIIARSVLLEGALLSLLHHYGLIGSDRVIGRMAPWLKGMEESVIQGLSDRIFTEEIKKRIRPEIAGEIRRHCDAGACTVVLSAATRYVCEPVREYLGMDRIICSSMEVREGKFTGVPEGRYCYGIEKLHRIREFCETGGFSLEGAWYYADSESDMPVFEAVGFPVCVSPKRKLSRHARSRGWKIL